MPNYSVVLILPAISMLMNHRCLQLEPKKQVVLVSIATQNHQQGTLSIPPLDHRSRTMMEGVANLIIRSSWPCPSHQHPVALNCLMLLLGYRDHQQEVPSNPQGVRLIKIMMDEVVESLGLPSTCRTATVMVQTVQLVPLTIPDIHASHHQTDH